jgi:peptide/nickel transport system permease protein
MGEYLRRRLLVVLPTVLGVASIVFLILPLIPGDPVDAMLGENAAPADRTALRHDLGLDRPLHERYLHFVSGLARGDLGQSIQTRRPVRDMIAERYPATLALAATACTFAIVTAILLGLMAAAHPHGLIDRATMFASLFGVAIPNFWLGPMLILLFTVSLGWLPASGAGGVAHLVLPAATLGFSMAGILVRMFRNSLIEALEEDYVRTARAKGATETRVRMKHALANALTPLLSVAGLQAGSLLAGSVVTETIFSWPGIGRLTVQAIEARDYPVVQGCVLTIAISYTLINLATDLAYAWVDPRITLSHDRA